MDIPRSESIPEPAVRRISLYLRQLEAFRQKQRKTVSSKQLSAALALTDAQVRKDLGYFGQFGHPGIGYRVDELILKLRQILGTDHVWNVVLVGAGNLGRALMAYRGFEAKGFKLAAVFDSDKKKVGKRQGDFVIQPLSALAATVKKLEVKVAIVAVPAEAAQDAADALVEAGVLGILNFAPAPVTVAPRVTVNSVDLAVQLEQISFGVSLAGMKRG
jgi:redox-sensing transcriptional repressor